MHADSVAPYDLRPFQLLQEGWRVAKPCYIWVMLWLLLMAALFLVFIRTPVVGAAGIFLVLCVGHSGLNWFLLRAVHGERVSFKTFFEPIARKPMAVMLLFALTIVLVLLGFALLVLPGLYLLVAFELSLPLLLAQDLTPWQALSRSRQLVHRQLGDFVLLTLALVVLNAIAAPFVLPLLWTLPATCGAAAALAAQALGWRSSVSA